MRFGHSFVYSPVSDDQLGLPLGEADFLRLTDGTHISQPDALAPGVTVSSFDIFFYGLDVAVKWRGWSVNAEGFLRWIEDIRGDGALAAADLLQRGFYVEGGCFLIPQTLDFNLRYSQVDGLFGGSSEYAGGINWYPLDTHKMKISFDCDRFSMEAPSTTRRATFWSVTTECSFARSFRRSSSLTQYGSTSRHDSGNGPWVAAGRRVLQPKPTSNDRSTVGLP